MWTSPYFPLVSKERPCCIPWMLLHFCPITLSQCIDSISLQEPVWFQLSCYTLTYIPSLWTPSLCHCPLPSDSFSSIFWLSCIPYSNPSSSSVFCLVSNLNVIFLSWVNYISPSLFLLLSLVHSVTHILISSKLYHFFNFLCLSVLLVFSFLAKYHFR